MSSWHSFSFCWDNMHIVLVIFFSFGWVLLGIQEIAIKEVECVTLGSLNTVWGIYKLWYGSSVPDVGISIRS